MEPPHSRETQGHREDSEDCDPMTDIGRNLIETLGRCYGENERLRMTLREILAVAAHAKKHSEVSHVIALSLQVEMLAIDGLSEVTP